MASRLPWFLVMTALVLAGCTVGSLPGDLPDADFPSYATVYDGPDHECDLGTLSTDAWNCGACGTVCSEDSADRCVEGVCSCGGGDTCQEGTLCRGSSCVSPDPDGMWCEFSDDECPAGYSCVLTHCTWVECVPEVCDNFDNDCDGSIDEGSDGSPLSSFCYVGSRDVDITAISDPCRPGAQLCTDGEWSDCFGEVAPIEEAGLLSCDEVDNDCDGCIDGELIGGVCKPFAFDGLDILYLFDVSGSMLSERAAVIEATRSFSSRLSPDMRFAVVSLPGPGPTTSQPVVMHDFTPFSEFDDMLSLTLPEAGGGEPIWDSIYESATGEIARYRCADSDGDGRLNNSGECYDTGETGLSWRDRSIRIMILFTDEEGQSYRSRRWPEPTPAIFDVTQSDVCSALTHGEVWVTVTEPSLYGDYNRCGATLELTEDAIEMAASLATVLVNPCGSASSL